MQRHPSAGTTDGVAHLSVLELTDLVRAALSRCGLIEAHSRAVAQVMAEGERDDCRSHGIYRLPWCIKSVRTGMVSPDVLPSIQDDGTVIIRADAHHAFSPLALETSLPFVERKARQYGLAALVINNCYHFSALWPEVEAFARRGLVAIAMNPSNSCVAPAGGSKPLLGTNPFAFAWPRPGKDPYVFDFATSAVARGEIELHRIDGKPIPLGWGVNTAGKPTTDAAEALRGAMLTFGGHKGSAISTMIELLGGVLIGDLMSYEATAHDNGAGVVPFHGELLLVISPELFSSESLGDRQARAERFFAKFSEQGARMPSERRYRARAKSIAHGIPISLGSLQQLRQLAEACEES